MLNPLLAGLSLWTGGAYIIFSLVVFSAGVPLPVLGAVPAASVLRGVLSGVPGAQGLVLLGAQHALRLPAHLW